MLICRKGPWRVESDGYLSAAELQGLDALRKIESLRERDIDEATSRLAERARAIKRRALRSGYEAGQRSALRELVGPQAAAAFAADCLQTRLAEIVMSGIAEVLGELPRGVVLMGRLRRCIAASRAQHMLSVRVSASDYEEAQRVVRALELQYRAPVLTVLADAELPPRSLIVETEHGVIDGSLEPQLRALESGVKDAVTSLLNEYRYMDDESAKRFAAIEQDVRETIGALGDKTRPARGEPR